LFCRKELLDQGIKFTSQTDTEVIAQLIGVELDKGVDTKTAVKRAVARSVSPVGLSAHPDELTHYHTYLMSDLDARAPGV
jgi:glutamine phosphoribosylpyrophosphate amidotransferase